MRDALRLSEELRAVALAGLRRQYPDEPLLSLVAECCADELPKNGFNLSKYDQVLKNLTGTPS